MLLGNKSILEMSDEEMLAAIEELRSNREALRSEAIKRHREGKIPKVREKKERKKKEQDLEVSAIIKGLLG